LQQISMKVHLHDRPRSILVLETAHSDPSTQGLEFEKEETVRFIERAVGRIARWDSVEPALRELEATLLRQ
jgi:hypothetical protein